MKSSGLWCLGSLVMLAACRPASSPAYTPPVHPLFARLSPEETGLTFQNTVKDDSSFNVITYRNFYNGGGVAIGDVNNDGWADVYLTCNSGKNRLYLNQKNWKFKDVTDQAGVGGTQAWSTGVTMADVNGDGWLDIYVCNSGNVRGDKKENELFINNHDGTFTERAAEYGLNDRGYSTHAAFFDYDGDGDLDCYVLNNSFKQIRKFDYRQDLRAQRDSLGGDKLYRNDSHRTVGGSQNAAINKVHFTDASAQAGIFGSEIGFGLGISVADLNGDHWPDLYVSNDFFERDYLYLNTGKGSFREVLTSQVGHLSLNSMGADIADINNDGRPDIFTTDMLPEDETRLKTLIKYDEYDVQGMKTQATYHFQYLQNALQMNLGNEPGPAGQPTAPLFSEQAYLAGVAATDWSWGALIFDFENDGWKDLLVCNGMYRDINNLDFIEFVEDHDNVRKLVEKRGKFDYRDILQLIPSQPIASYAFVNQRNGRFTNKAYELGLGQPGFRNGAAYGDLDNDGDLDLITNNLMESCGVFRNQAREQTGAHFLKINFKGQAGNGFGVGAEVRLWAGGKQQVLQQMPARGFQSCVEPVLLFGLGKVSRVDSLDVTWPGPGSRHQRLNALLADRTLTLDYRNTVPAVVPGTGPGPSLLLTDVTPQVFPEGAPVHRENLFVDFNRERLMPHLLSTQGPKLAIGDANGDGLDDVFMGAARGQASQLFIQTPRGAFRPWPQKDFEEDKDFEDAEAAFFDVDGDKDLDLMVASGGNETQQLGIVRLYVNQDGKGNFRADPTRSPAILVNASCLRPADYDGDGDLDVFVGGRSVPGQYGALPRSYLLRNEGGAFVDATPEVMSRPGMVTSAAWLDVDNDQRPDLVVAGEWMALTLFKNEGGTFRLKASLENAPSTGWWNCLTTVDLDQDGDLDIVAGNWGLNTRLTASPQHPMQLTVGDFDQNEVSESLLSIYRPDGQGYPYHTKTDLTAQVPGLKKRFLHYADYARQPVSTILTPDQLKTAQRYEANCLETSVFWNESGGRFTRQALPIEAQVAPVMAVCARDLDGDKRPELILGGNFYGVKPELGRYDASYGVVLCARDKRRFVPIPHQQSGFLVNGEVRDIQPIQTTSKLLLVTRNNGTLAAWHGVAGHTPKSRTTAGVAPALRRARTTLTAASR